MKNKLSRKETPSIQSVDRCLGIVEEVARSCDPVCLGELANLLGINHSSAFRLANTLRRRGFLTYLTDRKAYILGPSVWRLSHQYDWGKMLIRVARDHLKSLANETQATAHLAIREGKQALFIDHAITNHVVAVTGQTGELIPLYCTAHGKALLADCNNAELKAIFGSDKFQAYTKLTTTTLEQLSRDCAEAKTRGYATDSGELHEWISCVAAPIRAAGGTIIGSIGVAAPLQHVTKDRYRGFGEQVLAAAQRITNLLDDRSGESTGAPDGSAFNGDSHPSVRLAAKRERGRLHPVKA
jgi:DNA-binding IclR family transcriptional regulator